MKLTSFPQSETYRCNVSCSRPLCELFCLRARLFCHEDYESPLSVFTLLSYTIKNQHETYQWAFVRHFCKAVVLGHVI